MSLLSSRIISVEAMEKLVDRLKGRPNDSGWVIERNLRSVELELASDDLEFFDDDVLAEAETLLGGVPRTRVAVIFENNPTDNLELRMVRAIGMAMAERWPVVLDDHYGNLERIHTPGQAPAKH